MLIAEWGLSALPSLKGSSLCVAWTSSLSIEDAKRNAKRMGFDNTLYEAGTAEEIIPRWYAEGYRADALIVDPPRTGLDDKLLETIVRYAPERWSTFPAMSQL